MKSQGFDTIVIGGGAAGLFCASRIAAKGMQVLVLERANKVARKVLMSGGGRCNFTNMMVEPDNYLSANPHFCISALNRYTQWDFVGLVGDYEIPYHEKTLGQLFCDRSAKDIVNLLLAECEQGAVRIRTQCNITDVNYGGEHSGDYQVSTDQGLFHSPVLVVASGGLSIPSMGVTGLGYELAQQFGMSVLPQRAGLVPFTLGGELKTLAANLSGLSTEVVLANERASFSESLLFTHRGLSGPVALQLSSYWHPGETVELNLLPRLEVQDWLRQQKQQRPKTLLRTLVAEHLPRNLVMALEQYHWSGLAERPLADWSHQQLDAAAQALSAWALTPAGTEGYRTAEVTLGGVDTDGLSSKTMESRSQSGLFFIGEVVDVTGHLGGYNFQWAWSSAVACAEAVGGLYRRS